LYRYTLILKLAGHFGLIRDCIDIHRFRTDAPKCDPLKITIWQYLNYAGAPHKDLRQRFFLSFQKGITNELARAPSSKAPRTHGRIEHPGRYTYTRPLIPEPARARYSLLSYRPSVLGTSRTEHFYGKRCGTGPPCVPSAAVESARVVPHSL